MECKKNENIKMKKPPQVRQTLTSKYRLLKANPLLMIEMEKKLNATLDHKDEFVVPPLKTLVAVLNSEPEASISNNFVTNSNLNVSKMVTKSKKVATQPNPIQKKPPLKRESLHPNFHRKQYNLIIDYKKQEKLSLQPQKVITKNIGKSMNSTILASKEQNAYKLINKSAATFSTKTSTKDLKPQKYSNSIVQKTRNINLMNSRSLPASKTNNFRKTLNKEAENIKNVTNLKTKPAVFNATNNNLKKTLSEYTQQNYVDKISEEKFKENSSLVTAEENNSLKTSNNTQNHNLSFRNNTCNDFPNEKKSNIFTPSNSIKRHTMFGTPGNRRTSILSKPESKEISEKLNDWLKKKGKNLGAYHHLKCFGVHARDLQKIETEKEQKENIQAIITEENKEEQFEKLDSVIDETLNLEIIAQDALYDLHKLILEGYSPEQCALWLKLIKQKCKKVEEGPQYWECRAALEQTRGNISLAVECYKNAIIQGAEVQKVDSCLDQLYQKFNLLSIDETNAPNIEKNKIYEDMKHIFKSNIIQFAVQEKICKKKNKDGITTTEKRYVATPVRRSTRLSRSAFTSTPGVKLYSSLIDVDNSIKQHLNFQCNNALKD